MVILEYKRRLLKSRPSEQKVGIEGISTTSQEEASAEAAAKRRVHREPGMEEGAVVVLRQVPLEWL